MLDLGTSSGAILVTLLAEWPDTRGLGIDIDPAALAVAAENARRHAVGARAAFRLGDWTEGIAERFGLVVANPPYIAASELDTLAPDVRDWEPRHALTPGPTGLEAYVRIAAGLPVRARTPAENMTTSGSGWRSARTRAGTLRAPPRASASMAAFRRRAFT